MEKIHLESLEIFYAKYKHITYNLCYTFLHISDQIIYNMLVLSESKFQDPEVKQCERDPFMDVIDGTSCRTLLDKGYLPTESFIYRVCDNEICDIVQVLCDLNVFCKVLPHDLYDDYITLYAAKQPVAQILLRNNFISQDVYDSYKVIWKSLKI